MVSQIVRMPCGCAYEVDIDYAREGVFTQVLKGGVVRPGDVIEVIEEITE